MGVVVEWGFVKLSGVVGGDGGGGNGRGGEEIGGDVGGGGVVVVVIVIGIVGLLLDIIPGAVGKAKECQWDTAGICLGMINKGHCGGIGVGNGMEGGWGLDLNPACSQLVSKGNCAVDKF